MRGWRSRMRAAVAYTAVLLHPLDLPDTDRKAIVGGTLADLLGLEPTVAA